MSKPVVVPELTTAKTEFISDSYPMNGITARFKIRRPISMNKKINITVMVANAKTQGKEPFNAEQIFRILRPANLAPLIYDKQGDIPINKEGTGQRAIQFTETYKEAMNKGAIQDDSMTITFEVIPKIKQCSPIVGSINKQTLNSPKYTVMPRQVQRNYYTPQIIHYDSKKETGFVGIKNQGATCYMNSILQTLYNIPSFRRLIYSIQTSSVPIADRQKDIVLNLQLLFFKLQTSLQEISTTSLIKSFGWDRQDAYIQHDSTEFWIVLMDILSQKLRQTPGVMNDFDSLFQITTHIMATPVGTQNSFQLGGKEPSRILPLRIEGVSSINESITLLGTPAMMDEPIRCPNGQNSVVTITTVIDHLPHILAIQLMRFSINSSGERYKLNTWLEYSDEITIHSLDQGLLTYTLHGVVCHNGSAQGGHYYAYLRPTSDNQWFCFNDTHVSVATQSDVFEKNFNDAAYILLYCRKDLEQEIFRPIPSSEIPPYVQALSSEQTATTELTIISDDSIKLNTIQGRSGFRNDETEKDIIVNKKESVAELYSQVAAEFNIPPGSFSLWVCNSDGKPQKLITNGFSNSTNIETFLGNSKLIFLDTSTSSIDADSVNVMITFIKEFNPTQMMCNYIGSLHVMPQATVREVNQNAFPGTDQFIAFIENGSEAKRVEADDVISDLNIGCGSIIVFQKNDDSTLVFDSDEYLNYLTLHPEQNDGLYSTYLSLQKYIEVSFVLLSQIDEPIQTVKCPKQLPTNAIFEIASSFAGLPPEQLVLYSVFQHGLSFQQIKRSDETFHFNQIHTIAFAAMTADPAATQGFNMIIECCETNHLVTTRKIIHVLPNQDVRQCFITNEIPFNDRVRIMLFNSNKVVRDLHLDDIIQETEDCIRVLYAPPTEPYIDVSVDEDTNLHRPFIFFSLTISPSTNYEQLKEMIKRVLSVENSVFNRYRSSIQDLANVNQTIIDSTMILPLISETNSKKPYVHVRTSSSNQNREVSVRIYQ